MSQTTVPPVNDGPKTKDALVDAVAAFHTATGGPPSAIYVPITTYRAWTEWPDADKCGLVMTMDAVPERILGARLHVSSAFRML